MIEEINEQEYIGISEFAKRVNVSKQAVYQQLDKKLKTYLMYKKVEYTGNIGSLWKDRESRK